MAHNVHHLQVIVDVFSEAAKHFGLTISLSKTEVLLQPAPATRPQQPCITIDGTQLKNVESFKHLGSTISNDGTLDKEITTRIQKASQAFGRLRIKVLQHKSISLSTKLKVYNTIVLPSLLYGCETWTLYRRHLRKLEQFHTRSLHSIMWICRQDRASNQEVLQRASTTSIETMVLKAQLRWTGHVIRMDESRILHQPFYGELSQCRRNKADPRRDTTTTSSPTSNGQEFNQRNWRLPQPIDLDGERLSRELLEISSSTAARITTGGTPCLISGPVCASDFGLQSHMRVHR